MAFKLEWVKGHKECLLSLQQGNETVWQNTGSPDVVETVSHLAHLAHLVVINLMHSILLLLMRRKNKTKHANSRLPPLPGNHTQWYLICRDKRCIEFM